MCALGRSVALDCDVADVFEPKVAVCVLGVVAVAVCVLVVSTLGLLGLPALPLGLLDLPALPRGLLLGNASHVGGEAHEAVFDAPRSRRPRG